MRVALFGDVHGNPHALDATWEDIQSHTTPDNKACLRGLVPEIRFEVGGTRVLLFHGSPRKMNEYLFEDRPLSSFQRLAQASQADVIAYGSSSLFRRPSRRARH